MRKILNGLYLSVAAASLTLSVGSLPAHAQSTGASSGGIEEVVVTSERRSEALSKVPQSVTAFTADRMDQLDVKNFGDLVRYTPGVTFDSDTNNVSIRGINSDTGDATTGIYIDDTPVQLRTLGFGANNALPAVFDLERVEVLRGPQGTLFGAGSEGGTVRYITPAPSLTDFQTYAKAELSTTHYGAPSYEAGVAFGGPIVEDKLGFRVSGWWRHDGGYIDQVNYMTGATIDKNTNYTNTFVVRGSLLWQATSELTISPSIYYQNRHVNNDDEYWVGLSNPDDGRFITATPERMGNKDKFTLPALKIDYTPGNVELISDTSYFDRSQTLQNYSATLYDLSYFQQGSTNPANYDTTQRAPTVPGHPFGTYVDPDGVPCAGGICAANTAAQHADPSFVPTPLLLPDGINLPGFGHYQAKNIITNEQKNFTQEVRLQSNDPDARLTWILGAFYSHQSQLSVEEINDPQLPALAAYLWGDPGANGCTGDAAGSQLSHIFCEDLLPNGDDYINHTQAHERQVAAFANATYAFTDALKLQLGARIAATHFDFTNFSDGPQNFGALTGNTGKKNETPFTPMGSLTYQFNPDDMVYATIAKGYRIGGANPPIPRNACPGDFAALGLSDIPSSYNSDTVTSYEAGTKDRFMDGRLIASGSVYYLKWNNIQQSNYLPTCGLQYTTNLGAAESKGFDLQGEFLLTDALDIDFSLGYTDARYTSVALAGPGAGAPIIANKGDTLGGSPWTFSVGAQYNTQLLGRDSFLRVDYEFASKEIGQTPGQDPVTTAFDPALVGQPETNVVTLRAGMTFGDVNLSVFADNLFDATPRLNYSHQDSDTLLFEAQTLRPRTIGITATYRN